MKHLAPILIVALCWGGLLSQNSVDLDAVYRIKQEALERSQIMDHIFQLVEVHGPRLTGSPGFKGAAQWAVNRFRDWGLDNAQLEEWGPYGHGWAYTRFSAHLITPQYEALIGVPLGWTPGTNGTLRGTPIIAPIGRDSQSFRTKFKGALRDTIILAANLQPVEGSDEALFRRWTDEELRERATSPEEEFVEQFDYSDPDLEVPTSPERRRDYLRNAPSRPRERNQARRRSRNRLNRFLAEEGVALVIHPAHRGDGGTIFPPRMGSRDPEDPLPPPAIALTPEHYNRIYRLVDRGLAPEVEVEVETRFWSDDLNSVNVVAELPGTSKPDELVMIGAHLDSVAPGLGATDNAAGSAVMMEVMRILKTTGVSLQRTVRVALWGGEEQGLLGSRAYVGQHFADRETMELKPEHSKLSAYYNLDNGTGRIRGIYLQENEMVRPIFESWLGPFQDMGATTVTIRNTGGTDHLPFDAVGLPGFQFIQDPIEYNTRSHHSNMDLYDRIQAGDLMQASAVIASFVYHTANRAQLLPRKPLPEPRPPDPRESQQEESVDDSESQ